MAVMRLGYIHMRVTDLAEAKNFYVNTLGLLISHEEEGRIYLKGWDEWDHHSLVLVEGGVGVIKLGYKVETPEDLDTYAQRIKDFGCDVERFEKGDTFAVGEGVRFTSPSGHLMELYHEIEFVDRPIGLLNPQLFPRDLKGIGIPKMDHCLLKTDDIPTSERFFIECLDFKIAERLLSDLTDDGELIGTWLFCQHKTHDVAFVDGEKGRIHHFGWKLESWEDIKHAGSILSMDEATVGFGPDVHGLSRGETIYFFDPSGNRNEVFAGGYETYPDWPTMTWTMDEVDRAVSYIGREIRENHFTVDT